MHGTATRTPGWPAATCAARLPQRRSELEGTRAKPREPVTEATPYAYRHFGSFRLLLASLVMFHHYAQDLAPEPFPRHSIPFELGSIAVLAFFALSGFVITEAVDRVYSGKPIAFIGNRLLRIVPHFVVAVAVSVLLHKVFVVAGDTRLSPRTIAFLYLDFRREIAFSATNITSNMVSFLPFTNHLISSNFIAVAWAVRVEMAFYGVVFLAVMLAQQFRNQCRLGILLAWALLPFLPLYLLAMRGYGPEMFIFVPYFAFGSALYFSAERSRMARYIALAAVPAMTWQFLQREFANPVVTSSSIAPWINVALLSLLLGTMALLGFGRFARFRTKDRLLGNLTYPLYLYHEDVLILMLTFTVGYTWSRFAGGLLLGLLAAIGFYRLIDPSIGRYRNWIRGRALDLDRTELSGHPVREVFP